MTNEEAIELLNKLSRIRSDGYFEYLSNGGKEDIEFIKEMTAFDMGIEALKKQIPRNPLNTEIEGFYSAEFDFACPNCKAWFAGVSIDNFQLWHKPYHCECCGQAIDWSNNEENTDIIR